MPSNELSKLAKELARKIETEEDFRDKLAADPLSVLKDAGVPVDVAEASVVYGNLGTFRRCVDTTCWSSACPGTCSVTAIESYSCHCP